MLVIGFQRVEPLLSSQETISSSHLKNEDSWIAESKLLIIQEGHLMKEISDLKDGCGLNRSSPLIPLHPFL